MSQRQDLSKGRKKKNRLRHGMAKSKTDKITSHIAYGLNVEKFSLERNIPVIRSDHTVSGFLG